MDSRLSFEDLHVRLRIPTRQNSGQPWHELVGLKGYGDPLTRHMNNEGLYI